MKISYIIVNNKLTNLYINSGDYVLREAKKIKEKVSGEVIVGAACTSLTDDELLAFIHKHEV